MKSTPLTMIAARMETVRREISRLEAELDRLKIAGEVMAEIAGIPPEQAQAAFTIEHKPGFTIRRTVKDAGPAAQLPAPKAAKPAKEKPSKRGSLSRMILGALEHGENLRSSELAAKLFGPEDLRGRKKIWQHLHTLKKEGYVSRDEAGRYSRTHVTAPASNGVSLVQ